MDSDDDDVKEPAYLTNLKAFGSGDPTLDEVEALEVEMFDGPDRAAALVLEDRDGLCHETYRPTYSEGFGQHPSFAKSIRTLATTDRI